MKTFGRIEDCPPVERALWNSVACSYGDFEGIKELSFTDLLSLRSLVDRQMHDIIGKAEPENS